ncbi:uncharacterized protein LOC129266978 [Lytechinus pictus]|uniref:uncharacterized protein LOC129266978 n=1 Tax=Lytechinus pictus TaxID=7653 RepID=UPI0030B9FD3D
MAVLKRKQMVLWILNVVNICSFMIFPGICGDVPDDVVYTELHKDVRIGDRAVLPCRFRGSPLAVYWKKGEDPRRSPNLVSWITTDDDTGKCQLQSVCDIMEMNENYSLVIKEVSISELGRYICRVSNYKGNIINNFTDVSVYAPPKEPYPIIDGCINLDSSGSNYELCRIPTNDSTITLTCSVTNYYPQIELFFLHGSKKMTTINPVQQTNADLTKNRSISIEARVSETPYTCVASDIPGSLTEQKAATILLEPIPSPTTETIKKQIPAVKIVVPLTLLLVIGTAGGFLWRKRTRRNINRLDKKDNFFYNPVAADSESSTFHLRIKDGVTSRLSLQANQDFDGILQRIAQSLHNKSDVNCLGTALGFGQADINAYTDENERHDGGYRETLDMLRKWAEMQANSTERVKLLPQLLEALLVILDGKHLSKAEANTYVNSTITIRVCNEVSLLNDADNGRDSPQQNGYFPVPTFF